MLQFAVKKKLKPEVALPLIRLSSFLRALWSKVINLDDLKKLQQEIVEVLCRFEMIFPFEVICGPQYLQNMFPIERYLGKLKSYVLNRSRPEGSIAEGYLAEECVTFCSRFLGGDEATKKTMYCPSQVEYHIGTRRNKARIIFNLNDVDWNASHRYVLFNSRNKEVERLIKEHQALVDKTQVAETSWCRDDIPTTRVPIPDK
ncbi:hypothetical protein POM88_026548 [Heracleum sosnowskyi]|uniref:DUF4218 domain-containing protein n=1 Tax=Heracleum sosnowskyi TaxID=360622 RepID=A0AAD8MPB8_9APIA|nr:hypothetical protein POM88_026548 [Heracleum sosnowskyi]